MTRLFRALVVGTLLTSLSALADEGAGDKKAPAKAEYSVDTSASTKSMSVKDRGLVSIHIKPGEGLKVHPQAPLEVKLKTSAGLKSEKNKLGRGDVKDPAATAPELTCALSANAGGKQTVEADLSFFLCSESWCQRMKDRVVVEIDVKP